jgi:hypothetical protein
LAGDFRAGFSITGRRVRAGIFIDWMMVKASLGPIAG